MTTEFKTFLPAILQGISPAYPLGCQIEGRVGSLARWIVPRRQYQIGVKWREVEAVKGFRDWSIYDADFAVLRGQRVTAGVKCVPEWARLWPGYVGSPPIAHYYPELAKFIIALIERYRVNAVELFNEPDTDRDAAKWAEEYFGAWCIDNDFYRGGRLYGQCLETVYAMVHEVYPGVRIIAGALIGAEPSSLQFLDGALEGGLQCDAVSYHKYISIGGDFNAAFRFGLAVAQRTPKSQVLSETSVTAKDGSPELRRAQAEYLTYLRENYQNSCIDVMQWYTLAGNGWMNSDLIYDGQTSAAYEVWRVD